MIAPATILTVRQGRGVANVANSPLDANANVSYFFSLMSALTTRFCAILRDLRGFIAAHMVKDPLRVPLFTLLWTHIGRTARRFESLFNRWQAGTLAKPRPSRAGRPGKPREPQPRLPRGRVWVVAAIGYRAAGHASQLQHLLADPDMAAFLHAVPQAGRVLRPLCHILGIDPPPVPERPVNATFSVRPKAGWGEDANLGAQGDLTPRSTRASPLLPPRFSPA